MEWIVVVSVIVMLALSLLRVHVIFAIIIAAIVAGLMAGMNIQDTVNLLIEGMGGQASTALSYILLGVFAAMISYTGITSILVRSLIKVLTGKKTMLVLAIAGIASLSQNAVPVHIAFIPILIPPLLKLFDQMQLDRRAVATALTFGLKAPYVMIPLGYGLIFHETIQSGMSNNGIDITVREIALSLLLPGIGMIIGLLIAVFISYRKPREAKQWLPTDGISKDAQENITFNYTHGLTILAILAALVVQIFTESLVIGALTGVILMVLFFAVPLREGDAFVQQGVGIMGTIAFVMLVSSGFGHILQETGAVDELVASSSDMLAGNQAIIAFILLLVGLVITLGIGSSFGTIPIIAALYVPICMAAGFSPMAIAVLIGTAGALGDAGSPASDSTLGPTSGLSADGKHHHIWDTCVPTFLHFNIPLFLFGWIASIIL
ncbi:Na+/H+ antiporter family protein [Gracilibacillus thailandensis]|uniref:TRAP transporter large permease subunit n=1 Tax=Gracilibacillus thailandensis TaxID=563735 RepID=A0A6N7R4A3_9BACI|nr:Na+/H+ antiporter NhaC family protein [Gracilibacillus thailandensis]MRI68044.1 TRAP transporter large permease subunit [Gracilibacillus thailandensis]